jgi:hypothetical protein
MHERTANPSAQSASVYAVFCDCNFEAVSHIEQHVARLMCFVLVGAKKQQSVTFRVVQKRNRLVAEELLRVQSTLWRLLVCLCS